MWATTQLGEEEEERGGADGKLMQGNPIVEGGDTAFACLPLQEYRISKYAPMTGSDTNQPGSETVFLCGLPFQSGFKNRRMIRSIAWLIFLCFFAGRLMFLAGYILAPCVLLRKLHFLLSLQQCGGN